MKRLIIVLGLFCLFSIAQAQEATENIFGVPAEMEFFADLVSNVERLPVYGFLNEEGFVYFYDPSQQRWNTFLYPDHISTISSLREFPNNRLLLIASNVDSEPVTLLLDLASGEFSPSNLPCGYVPELYNDLWRFTPDLQGICHYATQTIFPFPDEFASNHSSLDAENNFCLYNFTVNPISSLDGKLIFIPICGEDEDTAQSLYKFDIDNNSIEEILSLSDPVNLSPIAWSDDTWLIALGDFTNNNLVNLYKINTINSEYRTIFEDLPILNYKIVGQPNALVSLDFWSVTNNVITYNRYYEFSEIRTIEIDCNELELDCSDYLQIDFISDNEEFVIIRTNRTPVISDIYQGIRYLISTTTNTILFPSISSPEYLSTSAFVVDDTLYWIEPRIDDEVNRNLHLVSFDSEQNVISERIVPYFRISPNARYVVSWGDSEERTINIHNLETDFQATIMTVPDNFTATIYNFSDDNRLIVNLWSIEPERRIVATWYVQLIETDT